MAKPFLKELRSNEVPKIQIWDGISFFSKIMIKSIHLKFSHYNFYVAVKCDFSQLPALI